VNKKVEWPWGGVTCSTLALDQVDDIAQVLDEEGVKDFADEQRRLAAKGGGGALACCSRARGRALLPALWQWAVALFCWWLPLPFSHMNPYAAHVRLPPPALFVAVKYSINEMLDAALDGAGTRDAATSRAVLAAFVAQPEARTKVLNGAGDPRELASFYSDYHAEAAQLIDLARSSNDAETVPLMQLLAHRKWDRMYKLRFWKLGIVRGLSLVIAWALLLVRYALPDDSPAAVSISGALLFGSGLVFSVHALRELFFRAVYLPERFCRTRADRGRAAKRELDEAVKAMDRLGEVAAKASGGLDEAAKAQLARDIAGVKRAARKAAHEDPPPSFSLSEWCVPTHRSPRESTPPRLHSRLSAPPSLPR